MQNRDKEFQKKAYIIQHKNLSICRESTSGGAFSAIATYILNQGGVVFGAALMPDYSVRHTRVETEEELRQFRNSKYVQSSMGDIFIKVKEDLAAKKYVCFSGTPCQIAGLQSYLNAKYEKLLLVDFVCRAVPSPGVWRKYVNEVLKKQGEIKDIKFRDKGLGYQYSTMKIEYDKFVQREGIESDYWLRMFFSGAIIRPSCSECRFRSIDRESDITLWDCLNIHDYHLDWDEKKGATRLIVHSPQGENCICKIKNDVNIHEIEVEKAVNKVREFYSSPIIPNYRERFFDEMEKEGLFPVIKKYYPINILVLTKRIIRRFLNHVHLDIYIKWILRHN